MVMLLIVPFVLIVKPEAAQFALFKPAFCCEVQPLEE